MFPNGGGAMYGRMMDLDEQIRVERAVELAERCADRELDLTDPRVRLWIRERSQRAAAEFRKKFGNGESDDG
jgi:hypothetical protein